MYPFLAWHRWSVGCPTLSGWGPQGSPRLSLKMNALADVPAVEAAIVYSMEPLWGTAFAFMMLGERLEAQVSIYPQRAPIVEGKREYTHSGHQSRKGRENIPTAGHPRRTMLAGPKGRARVGESGELDTG
eukprot:6060061-Pyramimonas_sp.AAC.1